MAFRAPISRSLLATARSAASSLRSPPTASRLRPPPVSAPRLPHRRFSSPRPLGALGCTQSLLPLHSAVTLPRLTSHLSVAARACCELSQGT
ncbi:hypothetical protein ACMD2_09146 [Ananas comosus]|uniref:Protein NUCLEAR FUSION DEFECTIVE 6, chloroplastic/mitochondrial-like n=1 Tax=Ananas comosus TaxID=4615 RepID=A0A199W547_ANACO|nr:hypothetical protein ACMD2_09146 [Ananas comosus]